VPRLSELLAAKKLGARAAQVLCVAGRQGGQTHDTSAAAPPDLIDRLILILVNECVACLRERVVEDPDLVDAAVLSAPALHPSRRSSHLRTCTRRSGSGGAPH